MQGTFNHGHPHYRCRYPYEYAKSGTLDHPLTVYIREAVILPKLDRWIAQVFAPGQLKTTLQAMQQSQRATTTPLPGLEAARRTITDCDRRLNQYRAALDAGASPATVAAWISKAEADKAAAQQQLITASAARCTVLTDEQIHGMIKDLGDLTDRLLTAPADRKAPLYQAFGLTLTYNMKKRVVTVESQPASSVYVRSCPRGDLNPHAR
ncbi:hypothetical protein SANT12839_073540 [Streptomyces antimycoticus]|uniref:Recombinase zinc beta ribbon domain-containing protein n=2 Tax=Streptomyces antimycoticus TaxID=68175 RepID=A0A4D4KDS2_9ACTN|nr:hypothetical protein [Streptomyces antimycoticus]GDY46472.1 hypothetical protein SANT12839_073540 [Streptomyces antimycoticus]